MMAHDKAITPKYIPWCETEFWNDPVVVQAMNWMQRHLYRALLLKAHVCATRPYLPQDDSQLWLLADAGSLKNWVENKDAVLQKFVEQTVDGVPMWVHKRVLADFETVAGVYAENQKAWDEGSEARKAHAQKAANARWNRPAVGNAPACSPMPNDALTELKLRLNSTDKNSDSDSPEANSSAGDVRRTASRIVASQDQSRSQVSVSVPSQDSEPALAWAERMCERWKELRDSVGYKSHAGYEIVKKEHFYSLTLKTRMERMGCLPAEREDVERVMVWALTVSRRKNKPKDWGNPDVLDGSAGFFNAWKVMSTQYHNYVQSKNYKERTIAQNAESVDYSSIDGHDDPVEN
jgi:uncharacterized protein YdaU (DUF1376 family)